MDVFENMGISGLREVLCDGDVDAYAGAEARFARLLGFVYVGLAFRLSCRFAASRARVLASAIPVLVCVFHFHACV